MRAIDDVVEGYMDGFAKNAVEPGPNRSASYVHGWKNGRDDRIGRPRAPASALLKECRRARLLDELAGIHEEFRV